MEVKELEKAIHEWRRKTRGDYPAVIVISHEEFHNLMADKESLKHIELYEREGKIIGHKFNGIPLAIKDIDGFKIYSEEELRQEVEREKYNNWWNVSL